MTTSAVMSALRVAGRKHITASILDVTAEATGSHVFRMPRFTQVREKVANGAAVMSSPFSVGGHDWRIKCYPNGYAEKNKGCISLYLRHASHAQTGDAMAKFSLSILDKSSKPIRTWTKKEHRFTGGTWGLEKFIELQDLDEEKHLLEDDCISVLCDLTVDLGLHTDEYTDEAAAAEDIAKAPPPFGLRGLAEAIWNRQEADVKIVVGGDGHTFAAHRWLLESRSPVFKADLALSSSNELRVHGMDADVFKALLQFMYTDSPPTQLSAMAERLLVAADRNELEQLKLICEEALCEDMDTSSVADALVLAERHGCTVLREACIWFLASPGNLDTVLASPHCFEKLKTGCLSALLELNMKKTPPQEKSISTSS